jgi:hypothetical protein
MPLKFEDIEEIMVEEMKIVNNPQEFKEHFESFGMDFDDIGREMKSMMGQKVAAIFIVGFYVGLMTAQKHWEYRTPPEE